MEPAYDVDYFISKFEAIPEEKWCVDDFEDGEESGVHCALGHCGASFHSGSTRESYKLDEIICSLRNPSYPLGYYYPAPINDGTTKEYQQPTPKQRILAALYDIKANQMLDSVKEDLNNANKTILCQEKKHFTEEESIKM